MRPDPGCTRKYDDPDYRDRPPQPRTRRSSTPRLGDLRQHRECCPTSWTPSAEVGIVHPFPIQADGHPDRPDRHRHDRPGAHRHRQDARLRHHRSCSASSSPASVTSSMLAKPGAPAGPRRHPDPRAGQPGQQRPRRRRAGPPGARADRLRRRRLRRPARRARRAASRSSSARPAGCSTWSTARVLDLSHVKVLVLDEADEMLDLGFLPDVERILAKTPELRQTMLFSATMPVGDRHPGPSSPAPPGEHPGRVRRRRDDRAGDGAVRLPGARPRQARGRRPHPAGREPQPRDDLLPDEAIGPAGGRRPGRARLRGGPDPRRPDARSLGRRRSSGSAPVASTCWSPPTLRPAASTSTGSPT